MRFKLLLLIFRGVPTCIIGARTLIYAVNSFAYSSQYGFRARARSRACVHPINNPLARTRRDRYVVRVSRRGPEMRFSKARVVSATFADGRHDLLHQSLVSEKSKTTVRDRRITDGHRGYEFITVKYHLVVGYKPNPC